MRIASIEPSEPPLEMITQESLLDLPVARWGYLPRNVDSAGQLRPQYVVDLDGLRRWVRDPSHRHPIDGTSLTPRNRRPEAVPRHIVEAYRHALAAQAAPATGEQRRTPNVPRPERHRPRRHSPLWDDGGDDAWLEAAIMASLINGPTRCASPVNYDLDFVLAQSLQNSFAGRRSRSRSPHQRRRR